MRALWIAGATVASVAAVVSGPLVVSVPGGLLLAFVLPGMAIVDAVFRPGRRDVGVVERLVLVPALSLAVLVLGGLGLWAIGGSLNRAGWVSIAAAATLVALGAGVARSRLAPVVPVVSGAGLGAGAESAAAAGAAGPGVRRRLVRDVVPLVLATVLLAGIGWWSFTDSEKTYDVAVTTLSAAPPGAVDDDGNRTVQVSASGLTVAEGPYRLVITGADSGEIGQENLTPDTDGDWTGRVDLPSEERVTVDLFRGGESTALRTVIIAAAQ